MLRIADLLNKPVDGVYTHSENQRKLVRSISERGHDEDGIDDDDDDDYDIHADSCPEEKERHSITEGMTTSRLGALSLAAKTVLSSPISPSERSQYMTIDHITNPDENIDKTGSKTKKRSTRALFPALSEADRRAKQRMIVKRCYYKKINTIRSLREEVNRLGQQFQSSLRDRQQMDANATESVRTSDQALRDLYIHNLDIKESLRKENIRLRRLADEYYMKNQGRLRILLDSNHKEVTLFTPACED